MDVYVLEAYHWVLGTVLEGVGVRVVEEADCWGVLVLAEEQVVEVDLFFVRVLHFFACF